MTLNFDELMAAYLDTRIHVTVGERSFVTVPTNDLEPTVAPPGCEWSLESLPSALGADVIEAWVITAENPESNGTTSVHENAQRTDELRRLLHLVGHEPIAARGSSADGLHSEASFIVVVRDGESPDAVAHVIRDLAQRFTQNAVFCFRGDRQQLVGVVDKNYRAERPYRLAEAVIRDG